MFIRKVKKRNGKSKKLYETLHLVESIRTDKGPRQRLVLNLGPLDISPGQYHIFARRIEDILTGQTSLVSLDDSLERKARNAAKQIFSKKASELNYNEESDYQNVDVKSIEVEEPRSIGSEYLIHTVWKELELDKFFQEQNIKPSTLTLIKSLVIGRLIDPRSERGTKEWAERRSGLYELTGNSDHNSLNSYYRASDVLLSKKDELEKFLSKQESSLFSLSNTTFFFDLTNTYFEGNAEQNNKAQYGRSKEKRKDCKLTTLAMIIDEFGFSKISKFFPGNQSEPRTLLEMIEELDKSRQVTLNDHPDLSNNKKQNKTIVMDAGIATEKNISLLKEKKYNYITVNRGNPPFEEDFSDMQLIRDDALHGVKVEVKRVTHAGESYILCRSSKKQLKEQSMRERVESLFLERLDYLKNGLNKKGRTKKYRKILETIGRIKEKYKKVSQLYNIEVILDDGEQKNGSSMTAKDIVWSKKEDLYTKKIEGEGVYIIRTDRNDLSDEEIWKIYVMLTRIENAFRTMKSWLGLRPIFHQLEGRSDGHLFISVLAYHLLHIIENRLRSKGDHRSWATIRDIMSTHKRVTISFVTKEPNGDTFRKYLRVTSKLEGPHLEVYRLLNLSPLALPKKMLAVKKCSDDKISATTDRAQNPP